MEVERTAGDSSASKSARTTVVRLLPFQTVHIRPIADVHGAGAGPNQLLRVTEEMGPFGRAWAALVYRHALRYLSRLNLLGVVPNAFSARRSPSASRNPHSLATIATGAAEFVSRWTAFSSRTLRT